MLCSLKDPKGLDKLYTSRTTTTQLPLGWRAASPYPAAGRKAGRRGMVWPEMLEQTSPPVGKSQEMVHNRQPLFLRSDPKTPMHRKLYLENTQCQTNASILNPWFQHCVSHQISKLSPLILSFPMKHQEILSTTVCRSTERSKPP